MSDIGHIGLAVSTASEYLPAFGDDARRLGRGACLRNSGCMRFRPLVGGPAMMEEPSIIQLNVSRYREMLSILLDDDTRTSVGQLLGEAKRQLALAIDMK